MSNLTSEVHFVAPWVNVVIEREFKPCING